MNDQITIEETNQKLKFPIGAIFLIASRALWLIPNFLHLSSIPVFNWLFFAGILATGILALCKKRGIALAIPLAVAGLSKIFAIIDLLIKIPIWNLSTDMIKNNIISPIVDLLFIASVILIALLKLLKGNKKIFLYILYATFAISVVGGSGLFYIPNILFLIGCLLLGMYLANPYQKPKAPKTPASNGAPEVVANEYYISLGKHVCLLLFTFGVWNFMWIYKITRYTNLAKGEEERDPTKKLLLCIFVPFYSIYWTYKTALRVDSIAKEHGVSSDLSTICLILAIFVGFVPPILLQDKINGILTAAPAPVTEAKKDTLDNIEVLEKYKELFDKGIITQEEFDAKKKELLDL